jgi:uncharacterized protein (TIGR03435 family)
MEIPMKRLIVGGMLLGVMSAGMVQGRQTPLSFEAASIKPTVSASGVTGGCRGIDSKIAPTDPRNNVPLGRCVITAGRLSHLMSIAFDLPLQRISGFPDWDGPNRFDIQAKAEDPSKATEEELRSMLQAFMTDRFKLTLHREIKEMPTFSLVASKGGPKNLHPSEQISESMAPAGAGLVFKGFTMQNLAEFLSMMRDVARPVRDMTGIQGRFDFTLNVLGTKPEGIENLKAAIGAWETIFSDIQEQIGLRLESTRGPVENLIIDHAEKPQL